jgi:LPXTG-motif cell wall-anchored protein
VNLLKTPLRRTTAVVAGVFLGLAGAVALVSPASAHHPIVEPVTACKNHDGTWHVKWKVTNSEWDLEGVITEVATEPANSPVAGIAPGVTLPKAGHGAVYGVQQLPADAYQAKLSVKGHWVRNGQNIDAWNSGSKNKPHKKCEGDHTTPPTTAPPTTTPPTTEPTTAPTTPPTSAPTTPTATPTAPADVPRQILESDCTTITVGLENPADGKTITLHFTTSKGEERTTVIAPGETKTEKFSATPGFTVTVTPENYDGAVTETIAYEQPEGCDTSGNGGGLPVTGAAAGTIAGGAGLLLAVGAVLFVIARRRKVKFTA